METNNTFSPSRLMLLGKQSLIIYKKPIGITLAGFSAIIFIALMAMQSAANFHNWENTDSMAAFLFLFFQFGFIYGCLSFPAFRSKEKSMVYLMLPASVSEKFVFELLTRIVLYVVLMPVLFWLVANIEGIVVHYFIPDLAHYKFSFGEAWSDIPNKEPIPGWGWFAIVQGVLFVFIASLAGGGSFSKSPLLKTALAIALIVGGFSLYSFLLVKGMSLDEFAPARDRVLFIKNAQDAIVFAAIFTTAINVAILAMVYFRLKEKEA